MNTSSPRRLLARLAAAVVLALGAAASLAPSAPVLAQSAVGCQPGQTLAYGAGFAALKAHLADWMGDPVTCEYPDPSGTGDVHQRTSQGLAYWRKSTNTPAFTNGAEHWALATDGVVYWAGAGADPPAGALLAEAHPCLAAGTCAPAALPPPTIPPGGHPNYVYPVMPAPGHALLPCLAENPSCARDPWWAAWNEVQRSSRVQYEFLAPGLVTEHRFAEVVWLLWQWPEGRALLAAAADAGVVIGAAEGVGAFAGYNTRTRVIRVDEQFTRTSTWMLASVVAHELRHVADDQAGLLPQLGCLAAEQRAYVTEQRFWLWIGERFGGPPTHAMVQSRLSREDQQLYANLHRIATAPDAAAVAAEDYRRVCTT